MTTLRIATFNLLHGIALAAPAAGQDRPTGPPPADAAALRAAAVALDSDVVGLQEVDRHQDRSGLADQTADVAAALGARHWRFVPAVHGTPGDGGGWHPSEHDDGDATDGPTYGVGLVSRLPVLSWQVRRFPAAPFSIPLLVPGQPRPRLVRIPDEPRVAIAAVVDGPRGPFTVLTAHLSFVPGYNVRQLRRLTRWARGLPRPVVLAGDLNLPGRIPARISGWNELARAATYPSFKPRVQFDHLLGLGVDESRVRAHGATRLDVSDHCALWADLELG